MISSYPFSNYHILTASSDHQKFMNLSQKLATADAEYFHDELLFAKNGYFFEVVLGFDEDCLVNSNLDLSFFPFLSETKTHHLSKDQLHQAKMINRKPEKEGFKLASFLKHSLTVCEHSENLLYLLSFHGAKILSVRSIVSYKSYEFIKPYISMLQGHKNKSISSILTKVIKNLSNCIPGRLHLRQEDFLNAKLCLHEDKFDKWSDQDDFYDFQVITERSCVMLFSGRTVEAQSIVTVPSRVYSLSKLYLWRNYFTMTAQLAINGNHASRLLMTDTDSLALSSNRNKSQIEILEYNQRQTEELPLTSYTSQLLATNYLKSFSKILDFSSIDINSHLYKTLIQNDPRLVSAHEFLAKKRKSQRFFWKVNFVFLLKKKIFTEKKFFFQ